MGHKHNLCMHCWQRLQHILSQPNETGLGLDNNQFGQEPLDSLGPTELGHVLGNGMRLTAREPYLCRPIDVSIIS